MSLPPPFVWDVAPRARVCHTREAVSGEEVYRLIPYGAWHTEAALVWRVQEGLIRGGDPVVESMLVVVP